MRTLLYSPDSYGLGHVRRSLSLATRLSSEFDGAVARVLTGAPRAHYFRYPDGCDYMKLPSITKDEGGRYVSQDRDVALEDTVDLRDRLIREAADCFRPDLFLVDHSPLGLCGEVRSTLERLGSGPRRALRILGMRDVIDERTAVRKVWARDGVIEVLRELYDLILIYGQRDLFDPVAQYAIPPDVARKMRFVGYIPRNGAVNADHCEIRSRLAPRTGRLVLVTVGGGGDGDRLLRRFLRGYEQLGDSAPFEALAVTGPLMSDRKRDQFKAWAERLDGLDVVDYSPHLPELIEASSFVVSMGGYNTVCELASAGARALIVPRCFPRHEQLVRARLLAERGVARYLHPEAAEPSALIREVLEGLERPRPVRGWGLDFNGLNRASRALRRLADGPSPCASHREPPQTSRVAAL